MPAAQTVDAFLSAYPEQVRETASAARELLIDMLPGISETVDESARLLAYGYGPGYKEALFTLILSKTGVKLGIVRGAGLSDPKHLMAGTGKVHRHVQLRTAADIKRAGLDQLLRSATAAWRKRSGVRGTPCVES